MATLRPIARVALLVLALASAARALEPAHQVDLGDGTIADVASGLRWEKKVAADGVADATQAHDVDNRMTQAETQAWLESLDAASFGGRSGWRLPTQVELAAVMPAADHPSRSKRTSIFHRWPCRQGCTDLSAVTCSCVAVGAEAQYRTSTCEPDGTCIALGWVAEEPEPSVLRATAEQRLPARAVRTMDAKEIEQARRSIAARPTPLPNEIYAGAAAPRTQREVQLCKQGCSNRFLENHRGDELVTCLERCRRSESPPP